jgi:uncharacterized protein YkwD
MQGVSDLEVRPVRLRSTVLTLLAGCLLVPRRRLDGGRDPGGPGRRARRERDLQDRGPPAAAAGGAVPLSAARPAVAAPAGAPLTRLAVASYDDRVLALSNARRAAHGLRPLAASACADRFADSWAAQLARAGTLSHQPLRPVLTACRARRAAENVAFGHVSPEQLVALWMASPGHRTNLLAPASTHLGVGSVVQPGGRVYGVQVFLTV